MDFKAIVNDELFRKKISRKDLAKMLGISYAYLGKLMCGSRRWHEDLMNKTCEVLDIKLKTTREE